MEKKEGKRHKECKNLEKLKQNYELLRKKYSLPEFKYLNENFEIENIEIGETELLSKMIRKHMTEKIFYVLRSLEMFINPQNAPLFIFDIIKSFNETEKHLIKDLYSKIAQYEIEAFGLEAGYNEKKEAEFIKKFSEDWKDISEDLGKIYGAMRDGHKKDSKKQNKSYLG
jgi:hypothetical protein